MDWFIYSAFLLKLTPSHYKSYLPLNIYSYSAMARCTVHHSHSHKSGRQLGFNILPENILIGEW